MTLRCAAVRDGSMRASESPNSTHPEKWCRNSQGTSSVVWQQMTLKRERFQCRSPTTRQRRSQKINHKCPQSEDARATVAATTLRTSPTAATFLSQTCGVDVLSNCVVLFGPSSVIPERISVRLCRQKRRLLRSRLFRTTLIFWRWCFTSDKCCNDSVKLALSRMNLLMSASLL